MSERDKNKLIYTFLAIIAVAGFGLYWSLSGIGRAGGDENPDNSGGLTVVNDAPDDIPLGEALPPAGEVRLPEIIINQELVEVIENPEMVEVSEDLEPVETLEKKTLNISVPFTSQAPLADWSDERQQDGCEEASVLMAMAWIKNEKGITAAQWEKRIIDLADWELEKYGEHRDVSVQDTIAWMFKDYFSHDDVLLKQINNSAEIVAELEAGNLVLVPVDGQKLKNPNFTPPGPEHHFIVIKGYDYETREFITNDPGTRSGADYRYSEKLIYDALRSYPTGFHDHYDDIRKEAIVVSK